MLQNLTHTNTRAMLVPFTHPCGRKVIHQKSNWIKTHRLLDTPIGPTNRSSIRLTDHRSNRESVRPTVRPVLLSRKANNVLNTTTSTLFTSNAKSIGPTSFAEMQRTYCGECHDINSFHSQLPFARSFTTTLRVRSMQTTNIHRTQCEQVLAHVMHTQGTRQCWRFSRTIASTHTHTHTDARQRPVVGIKHMTKIILIIGRTLD